MWTLGDFVVQVLRCKSRYEAENDWFKWWGDPSTYIFCAWKMYRCASQSAMQFLLLGDTKIRKDPALVMNFGLASAHGVQEAEELKLIDDLTKKREGIAPRGDRAVPVLGPGAILSDRNWTPLLNDSFILGGIHRGWDFHLVEEGFSQFNILGEQEFLQRRAVFGPAAPQYAVALARGPEYYQQKWKHYLQGHAEVLWNEKAGCPRVFARELMGLKNFGYAARFASSELGFCCQNHGAAGAANFEQYLDILRATGFQQNDRKGILSSVAEFLFGERNALAQLLGA